MIARAIQKSWSGRGPLAWVLFPVSIVFGLVAALRRTLYRLGVFKSGKFSVPVIVIGNITVGGSGKTPLAIALIESLRLAGFNPGVVSRGHGGSYGGTNWTALQADSEDARRFGDEAVLIVRKTGAPVFVGKNRVNAAHRLLTVYKQVDVIICDDGLQHYGLKRDLELVVFDERGVSNGWLLPAGPLREPVSRLARVDAIVLNGEFDPRAVLPGMPSSVPVFRMRLAGRSAYRLDDPAEERALSDFRGKKLLAAAGIGNPRRFFTLLRESGIEFSELPLPDHYAYRENPFTRVDADTILITEKDAVKCRSLGDPRLWVVPVKAEMESGVVDLLARRIRHLRDQSTKVNK